MVVTQGETDGGGDGLDGHRWRLLNWREPGDPELRMLGDFRGWMGCPGSGIVWCGRGLV